MNWFYKLLGYKPKRNRVLFHGGCHGCTMQAKKGLGYCTGCQYFECNWELPNLNDAHILREQEMNSIRKYARKLASK